MAIINKLSNAASIVYGGATVTSNTVDTVLLLAPTLLKAVDRLTASIGDKLTYTVTITNPGLNPITNIPFTDVLPKGASFVADSFTLNGTKATPTLTNNTMTYTIPTIAGAGVAILSFQVNVDGGSV